MVECKFCIFSLFKFRTFIVLIDTWWNVNIKGIKNGSEEKFVLIDTWWNVNLSELHEFKNHPFVLIDTWWNVNSNRR